MCNNEKAKLTINIVDATFEKAYFNCKELSAKLYCNDEQTFEFEPGKHILKYTISTGAIVSVFAASKTSYKSQFNFKPGQEFRMNITIGSNRTHIHVIEVSTGKEIKVFTKKLWIA